MVRRALQRADHKVNTRVSPDPFVSYAQNHEDVVLARALHADHQPGFWIDVGAGDPVSDSVTAAFSERGWYGINVEPLQREYELLCMKRPADINLNVALGAARGTAILYQGPQHNRGATTMRSEIVSSYGADADAFTAIEVPVRTLADVVAEHARGPIDFLKIDVEGFEHDVLAGADFSCFRPRVLVVEATIPNTTKPSHESWEPMLLDAGYCYAMFDGLNRFYATQDEPDLLDALSIPANVFDVYTTYRWTAEFGAATIYAEDLERQRAELRADLARVRAELARSQTELERAHAEFQRTHAEVGRLAEDATLAWKTARYAQDEARAAVEHGTILQDELGAAQMRGARALAKVVAQETELAALEAERAEACAALEALQSTRTFRYTAGPRGSYARLRRWLGVSRR
jgi:FkbM family methyltransferase